MQQDASVCETLELTKLSEQLSYLTTNLQDKQKELIQLKVKTHSGILLSHLLSHV